jgi:8-oxo-dGTP pyrophosphatase MutT (NUDIX family)
MSNATLHERLQSCLRHDLNPLIGTGHGQAAVLMALSDTPEPELLLIRRSLQLSSHPGEIALPGGKAELADTDLLTTALRESWEEVALPIDRFRFCGNLTSRTSMVGLAVTAMVGVVPQDLMLQADAREVDEIIRMPLLYFADPANLRTDRVMLRNLYRIAPRYQYLHYTIWGITAGFIIELVNRLYGANLDIDERSQHLFPEKNSSETNASEANV